MDSSYGEIEQTALRETASKHSMQDMDNYHLSHGYQPQQKVWKVGTYSMGITLIGIGLSFAASLWQTMTSYELLLWLAPLVFIILGLELLIAHSSRFIGKYRVQYNWLGVLFVGCVGTGAIFLSMLLSSGLIGEVNQIFDTKTRSAYVDEMIPIHDAPIEKIIIKSELHYELHKQPALQEVSLIGLVQYDAKESVNAKDQQLLKTKQIGNVLYVFIQSFEYEENKFVNSYLRSQLVLNIPEHIEIEE